MNFNNFPLLTSSYFCGMCNIWVDSKTVHMKEVHGWVKCKFCPNWMAARFLGSHVNRKHWVQCKFYPNWMAARSLDSHVDRKHQQPLLDDDESESGGKAKRPRLTNTPPVELNDANRNDENDESKTVAENNEMPSNNAPESLLAAHKEKLYSNMIFVSDKVLNELLADGRISCETGKLFLRDS